MANIFERIAYQVGQKYLPSLEIPRELNKFIPTAQALLSGDLNGFANGLFDQLVGTSIGASGLELAGGVTLSDARRMFEECASTKYAKKNLWHISITNMTSGSAPNINLFATEVGYQPVSLSGDAIKVGSGYFDTVNGNERVEMRVTTYDDKDGTIKRWFEGLKDLAVHRDGTFGLPIEYLMRVTVTHAYTSEGIGNAYVREFVMRPGTMDSDLTRREDALEELQMTFVQFDTFTSL